MSDTSTPATVPVVKVKWYEESAGVVSSKRVFGAAMIAVGAAMIVILFVACLLSKNVPLANGALAGSIATGIVVSGASLLGISVGTDLAKAIQAKSGGAGL